MKKRVFVISILSVFILASCQKQEKSLQKVITDTLPKVDTSSIAIFSYDSVKIGFEEGKAIALNVSDLQIVESQLLKCINDYNVKQKQDFINYQAKYPNEKVDLNLFVIDLKRYKRQYVGILNKAGEKEVWISCLCDNGNDGWRERIILVFDGGNCYFQLKVNITKKYYYDFFVNGYA